ncbi:MAG: hydrolase Nlp/P60 [Flavobacteriales bacterium]|nr:MAG: hydrolase Nlp/P60 [Flavobacteriales bacterium]
MDYGLCNLNIIPLRLEDSDCSEMISQVLYGDLFEILEVTEKWCKVRLVDDQYEGWIDNKQCKKISLSEFEELSQKTPKLSTHLLDIITTATNTLLPISIGSNTAISKFLNHSFEGATTSKKLNKSNLTEFAQMYLNSPYLWGGKTPFGIDCSGFTQMVYKLCGYQLFRDAIQQVNQGEVLSFIEESEAGDLAFFDNDEGIITHVGIILENNRIIHAHGKVRIDQLDHSGIFNIEKQKHTHKLRVIKRMI